MKFVFIGIFYTLKHDTSSASYKEEYVMSLVEWIGNISLNISFILYLIVYIPQLLHNQKYRKYCTTKFIASLFTLFKLFL